MEQPILKPRMTIIDYGGCNLFSVKHAAEYAGFDAKISSDSADLFSAQVVVLPGVGAFGDGMKSLSRLGLVDPLLDIARSDKLLIGICLGYQLLFTESEEFGTHRGLNIIPGTVKKLDPKGHASRLPVPHIGWNKVHVPMASGAPEQNAPDWDNTPLSGIKSGEYFYFVHSYYPEPESRSVILTETEYGPLRFCSAVKWNNIFAFQFHPEKSGMTGIQVYRNIFDICNRNQLQGK